HAFVSNDAAHTDLYTLSLHDALPISGSASPRSCWRRIWEMSVEARWRMSYRTGRLLRCTEMSLVLALCLAAAPAPGQGANWSRVDRKSTRLNSSHLVISYAVFCLKKK